MWFVQLSSVPQGTAPGPPLACARRTTSPVGVVPTIVAVVVLLVSACPSPGLLTAGSVIVALAGAGLVVMIVSASRTHRAFPVVGSWNPEEVE